MKTMEIEDHGDARIGNGWKDHEGDDEDSLLKHKHHKIQQIPSHIFKIVATNNLKTLTSWSCGIQNGL
jgi:hypothetical protein